MPSRSTTKPRVRGGKQVVLRAAIANFTERGYHGTSMRDIARDADVTVASIYHHYPSKQEILSEIMAATLSDVIALTRSALMGAGAAPSDQLDAVVRAWINFHTTRQAEALIGASEIRSLESPGRKLVVALRDEQEGLFRDIIERGVELGEFGTPYPREAARAVINMGRSVASWYQRGGPLTPEEMASRYAELALATVRGPVPTERA
ncbi:TetR/AcrR family transcriptional regulator [Nocardioides campestrisoli]|uniref:TetR/AcrR family transcriptional regulator n=1 Tax=Nocardioides campestrisoli TaxID=2736757 RepID=UPI00163DA137|nr:TetR/AcrR family transcriptional regulator [Nocardioides campestrisoli]